MSNEIYEGISIGSRGDWRQQYDRSDAPDDIDKRQDVYTCQLPGRQPVDFVGEEIKIMRALGIGMNAVIVDEGCSFPKDLDRIEDAGHTGYRFGMDPYISQFRGRPHWSRRQGAPDFTHDQIPADANTYKIWFSEHFEPHLGSSEYAGKHAGTILVQAYAHLVPLPDNSADVTRQAFSLYHAKHPEQAVVETQRVLTNDGLNMAWLSAMWNKKWMHYGQHAASSVLSDSLGELVLPPPSIQSGLIAEDAIRIFAKRFKNNAARDFQETLIFDTNERCKIVMDAQMTQAEGYTIARTGKPVDHDLVGIALEETVERDLRAGLRTGNPVKDQAFRVHIVSSQGSLEALPRPEYTDVQALM